MELNLYMSTVLLKTILSYLYISKMCLKEIKLNTRSNEVGHIQNGLMVEQFARPRVKMIKVYYSIFFLKLLAG